MSRLIAGLDITERLGNRRAIDELLSNAGFELITKE